jgi:hypothetical protein
VKIGNYWVFVVISRRIEIDTDKVKAIQDMPTPKTKKRSKKFYGNVQAYILVT